MTIRRVSTALALTAALVVSAAGCGDDDAAQVTDTITVLAPLFGTAPDPNGELQQAVQKLIGKNLDITWVPNADYGDKASVTLALSP